MTDPRKFSANLDEAAVWFARLQSDAHDPSDDAAFRQWLAEDATREQAYQLVAGSWKRTDEAARQLRNVRPARDWRGVQRYLLGATSATVVALGFGWTYIGTPRIYETDRGERRRVVLEDRSQVLLDSNARISFDNGSSSRNLALERGRAHFSVAHDETRPFQVQIGGYSVKALGTEFDAEKKPQQITVYLITGKIQVSGASGSRMLIPGEQLTIDADNHTRLDTPPPAQTIAWQRGQVVFADTSLADAVAEFNRYSTRPLRIANAALARSRISGVFAIKDTTGFTQALPQTLPVKIEHTADGILITDAQ